MAANLSITTTDVAPVEVVEQDTKLAYEAIDEGEVLYIVAADGTVGLADQDESAPLNRPVGIALTGANAANLPVTFLKKGLIDLGDALSSLDYGAPVYLSATAGAIYDADPGNTILIGYVEAGAHNTTDGTADKLLRIDLS